VTEAVLQLLEAIENSAYPTLLYALGL